MPKIMLVEDDNNLREIYGERLMAEGYEIVSACDGEEALALAIKEKPDLIISDVMMPKISGFDMLDILRQTPETKNTKVVIMTALSQMEDKERADKLGADKYLVKSQVTLEDVARVVHDLINGEEEVKEAPGTAVPPAPVTSTQIEQSAPVAPVSEPSEPAVPSQPPVEEVAQQDNQEPTEQLQATSDPIVNPISGQATPQDEPTDDSAQSASPVTSAEESDTLKQQIDDFASNIKLDQNNPSAPLVEPSDQDIIHAQNVADEPTVVKSDFGVEQKNEQTEEFRNDLPSNDTEGNLEPASARKKIIEPLPEEFKPSVSELYEKEMANESSANTVKTDGLEIVGIEQNTNPITMPTPDDDSPAEEVDPSRINGISFDNPNPEINVVDTATSPVIEEPKPVDTATESQTPTSPPTSPITPHSPDQIAL
jgi:CheY-like chemotaxis protein